MVDVMVRAEDASKINRIVERFKLAAVDAASIKSEIQQSREERAGSDKAASPAAPEQAQPQKSEEDRLLDDMLGAPTGREEAAPVNPFCGTDGKISGLRAYLREAQQNRRGCC